MRFHVHFQRHLFPLLLPTVCLALRAQGKLVVEPSRLELGQVDADKGPVHFTLTLRNAGDSDLYLSWVDASCSCLTGDPEKGILPPGASTRLQGSFNPMGFSGNYQGELSVHAEGLRPMVTIPIAATIRPDAVPVQITPFSPQEIHRGQGRTYGAETDFHTRSGSPLDPSLVVVQPSNDFLGARVTFHGNHLAVAPYLEPALLPEEAAGAARITVTFRAAGLTSYVIPVQWHRADPVQVAILPDDGGFRITYEDRPIQVRRLQHPTSLHFRVHRSKDGHTVTVVPVRRHPKTGRLLPAMLPGETVTLITNHPTHPEVTLKVPGAQQQPKRAL